jgi:hypothetical protein
MHPSPPTKNDSYLFANTSRLLLFLFLASFAILDSLHDYFSRRGEGNPIPVSVEIEGDLLFWVPCFALVPAVLWMVKRLPMRSHRFLSIMALVLAGLFYTYFHTMIEATQPTPYMPPVSYGTRFFYILKFDFALDCSIYCIIVFCGYLLQQYDEIKQRELHASQLEAGLADIRLRAIQAQLNPHFFFNTLQAISVMALTNERDGVVEMLGRLSNLLRVLFDRHRPPQIALAAELEFLDGYLAINQLSLGERLNIRLDIEPETLNAYVPTMLLQPLVENAIVHGISVKPGRGSIRISGRRHENTLCLEVADSGPGFQTTIPTGGGVGLSSTESRLRLLYGDKQSIEYVKSDLGGASVRISIPFASAAAQGVKSMHGAIPA